MVPPPIDEFGPDRYGESFADVYDEWYDDVSDAEATAAFVDRLGESQRVLELGVGTGRLSTAISTHGHDVVGVDSSTAMLDRFRTAPGAVALGGDMQSLPIGDAHFDLALIATNTLFNLQTERAQLSCFTECRRVLRLGGRLVIEAMIPGAPDPALDRLVTTRSISVDRAVLTATIRDADSQQITGQHIEISDAGIKLRPWRIRYATLQQLDVMAEASNFRLGARYADWDDTPCGDASSTAVSVYVAS
jgi:ubiquinone/menaquinone biosynthesis C-methylase UbiE